MSDSLMLEVTGEGQERLVEALNLAPTQRITGVIWERTQNCLKLNYEHDEKGSQRLPFAPRQVVSTITDWLERRRGSNASYAAPVWPKEPDIDGDCERGWRLVADDRKIEIHPHWIICHK